MTVEAPMRAIGSAQLVRYGSVEDFVHETAAVALSSRARERMAWRGQDAHGCWYYKRLYTLPGATVRPNPLGEVLCPLLLAELGLPHLPAQPILVAGTAGVRGIWIVRLPYVGAGTSFGAWRCALQARPETLRAVAAGDVWRLFVFDLIVGNGDRTLANLLVQPDGAYLPRDHELALVLRDRLSPRSRFAHFTPGFDGLVRPGVSPYRSVLDRTLGTADPIAAANPLYGSVLARLSMDGALWAEVCEFTAEIARRFDDGRLVGILSDLPAELLGDDPAGASVELVATLSSRIAGVGPALERRLQR